MATYTTTTTTRLATMRANATRDIKMIDPLDAGNFPFISHCWGWWNLWYPSNSTNIDMPIKVAPSGLPMC